MAPQVEARQSSTSANPPPDTPRKAQRWRLKQDYRARLPSPIARFIGYRPPGSGPPFDPIPPLRFLRRIPLKWEIAIIATFASFVGILLVEALSDPSSSFPDALHQQIIVASFGASAVLVFGVVESPLAQPRNFVGGQILSALVGTIITRFFATQSSYVPSLTDEAFHVRPFFNGGLCMSMAFLVMFLTGTVHPPAGATALIAATSGPSARMSWAYVGVVAVSSLVMFGWSMIINNIGRRKYPAYWWCPEKVFVVDHPAPPKHDEENPVGGGQTASPSNQTERQEKDDRENRAVQRASSRASGHSSGSSRDRRNSIG